MNKEQLEAMSDAEINKAVAISASAYEEVPCYGEVVIVGDKECYYDDERNIFECHADYCDSYEDMMPLVFEHGIELSPLFSDDWCASSIQSYTYEEDPIYEHHARHENPLRAAAIVYLLMQGDI
jgi:hypothetical protein